MSRATESGWRGRNPVVIVFVMLAALWWVGCSGCNPPPVVDAPASNLNVKVNVLDITETPSDGKVIVVMQFLQGGSAIQLSSGASMSCNGVPLPYNGLLFGYAERVPLVATGGIYTFRHSRAGVNTDVAVVVPPRPVFSSPTTAGASLARSSSFTIHYVAGAGTSVRGDASDATNSRNNTQPDDGTHDGLDVSAFTPGPGTLSITRILEAPIGGTGFLSAASKFETGKTITITWL